MSEPWTRRPDESAKAFKAFALYRDAGESRTMDGAYRAYAGAEKGGKGAPGFFRRWAAEFVWTERAAAYDAHREAERLAEKGTEEIEAFRERQVKLAAATTGTAIRLLQKLNERLNTLEAAEITPQMIPSYARAIASVAEASTNAEAVANGVAAILRDMDTTA